MRVSRRRFVATAAGSVAAPLAMRRAAAAATLTAQQVVDRIRTQLAVAWRPDTVDGFKAGDPAIAVKGIVCTALATVEVLRQAAKTDANLIITCEPTFFSRSDSLVPPPARGGEPAGPDPVFTAKNELIRKHQLVVWRFSDHWSARRPDPFVQGLVEALGWSGSPSADGSAVLPIPATTLSALASRAQTRLNAAGGIRGVGMPQTPVRSIGLLPGTTPIQAAVAMLPSVDVIIAGEVREWETVEYVRDTVDADGRKGLILLGRVLSEGPGMEVCARWLRTIVPEIPATWIPARDPYWRPLNLPWSGTV